MAHIHVIEDQNGQAVEYHYYCSDTCNQLDNGENYRGWYGCVELHSPENCKRCNTELYYVRENRKRALRHCY